MSYLNKWNLLNVHKNEPLNYNENCFLYTFVFHVRHKPMFGPLNTALVKLYNQYGMYDNLPFDVENHDKYTSHDQLTAYSCVSFKQGEKAHERIWKKIKRNFLTYDNTTGKFNHRRAVHPRDIIFIGLLNGSFICHLLLPFLWAMFIYTMMRHYKVRHGKKIVKTDGEILWYVRLDTLNIWGMKKVFNYFVKKRFGTLDNMLRFCFTTNHLITRLILD
jgi:hypothetical protein